MVDSRTVIDQFSEIKTILDQYSQHKLHVDEEIIVTFIVDKLPPTGKNFWNNLKLKKESITLEELGNHLHIEDLRKESKEEMSKINVVEENMANMSLDSRKKKRSSA